MIRQSWQDVAQRVQKHRDRSIIKVQPSIPDTPAALPANVTSIPETLLTAREAQITTTPPEELVESIACGKLSSTETTRAFLRRAGVAQKLVILPQITFDGEGLRRLDKLYHGASA